MSELGQILRELRGKRSLRDVADATGLSHSYIADVEKGYRRGSKTPLKPSPETLKRLSEAYDFSYEELMKKAGYLNDIDFLTDDLQSKELNIQNNINAFQYRLFQGFKENNITIEHASSECGVSAEYINGLLHEPKKLPGVSTLYRLADLIGVTPDYLGGFTDDPNGYSPSTPRPKDMEEFLDREDVMFSGVPLTEEDKIKVKNVLSAIFMDAKKRNKRKK